MHLAPMTKKETPFQTAVLVTPSRNSFTHAAEPNKAHCKQVSEHLLFIKMLTYPGTNCSRFSIF